MGNHRRFHHAFSAWRRSSISLAKLKSLRACEKDWDAYLLRCCLMGWRAFKKIHKQKPLLVGEGFGTSLEWNKIACWTAWCRLYECSRSQELQDCLWQKCMLARLVIMAGVQRQCQKDGLIIWN